MLLKDAHLKVKIGLIKHLFQKQSSLVLNLSNYLPTCQCCFIVVKPLQYLFIAHKFYFSDITNEYDLHKRSNSLQLKILICINSTDDSSSSK